MFTRYHKSPYTARVLIKGSLRKATISELCKEIKKEIKSIASRKYGDSLLRLGHYDLRKFSWKPVIKELNSNAPILMSVLKSALGKKSSLSCIRIVASILLKNFCKHLALPQAVVSIILYSGHCSNQVCVLKILK